MKNGLEIPRSRWTAIQTALLLVLIAFGMIATKEAIAQFEQTHEVESHEFVCRETPHSKKHWRYGSEVRLKVRNDGLTYDTNFVPFDSGSAKRDREFFNDHQIRYVDSSGAVCPSQDAGNIYLDDTIVQGEAGEMVLSGATLHNGHLVWQTTGAFHCEPAAEI
jgi:hypothetical protein